MNKKQAVFLRRFSARTGAPMKQLKRAWSSLPWNRRHAWKQTLQSQLDNLPTRKS